MSSKQNKGVDKRVTNNSKRLIMTNPIHSRMRSSIILSILIAGIFLPTAFSNAQTISINAGHIILIIK